MQLPDPYIDVQDDASGTLLGLEKFTIDDNAVVATNTQESRCLAN